MNLSGEDNAAAAERFLAIEPLVNPAKFPELWLENGNSKAAVVAAIAKAHSTNGRTIYRRLRAWDVSRLPGLAPKDRADKGVPRSLNSAALDFILAGALPKHGAYGQLSVRDIYRIYAEERRWRAEHAGVLTGPAALEYGRYLDAAGKLRESAQLPEASYETFRRWYARIPEVVKTMGRRGEEAFHNTQEIMSFRDIAALQPLEYVVMDHRCLDIFCLVPERAGWKLARPWLTAAIDMRTRRWLAWVIVETPSSDSIAAVLKRVFLDHGLPKTCYWDNGKDFRCHWLEGKQERSSTAPPVADDLSSQWGGVLASLGVRVMHAIVQRARSKSIEPNFLNIANFDRTLPEYCGHRPGSRPERLAKLIEEHDGWMEGKRDQSPFRTIHEIAELYGAKVEDLNEQPHTGEGMRKFTPTGLGWMCPSEIWEILIPRVPRRLVPAEVLQFCFAKRRSLSIRNGEVRTTFGGRLYHYRASNAVGLMAFNGRTVEFAYDPIDLGEGAVYYESRFIGIVNCVELRLMGEDGFVQDERDRRGARREVKRFIQTVHQQVPFPDAETHLSRRRQVVPQRSETLRPTVAAAVPAPILEAVAASGAERTGFEQATAPLAVEERPVDEGGDEFRFFSE